MSYLYILTCLFGVLILLSRAAIYLGNDHFKEWIIGVFLFPFAIFYIKEKNDFKDAKKNKK